MFWTLILLILSPCVLVLIAHCRRQVLRTNNAESFPGACYRDVYLMRVSHESQVLPLPVQSARHLIVRVELPRANRRKYHVVSLAPWGSTSTCRFFVVGLLGRITAMRSTTTKAASEMLSHQQTNLHSTYCLSTSLNCFVVGCTLLSQFSRLQNWCQTNRHWTEPNSQTITHIS